MDFRRDFSLVEMTSELCELSASVVEGYYDFLAYRELA